MPEPAKVPEPPAANGRPGAKQAYYQVADQLTGQGADRDHPLLSDHPQTRNDAVRQLADHLGYSESTVRKYAKTYLADRTSAAGD